ncbi:MAG: hypothetical protein R3F56_23615 [Planctomycetota bacterium]
MTAIESMPGAEPRRPPWWAWLLLAAAIATLTGLGFGPCRHDFYLADDFNALYAAQRATTLADAIDLDGAFRLRLIREVIPDFEATSTLLRPITALSLWLDHLRGGLAPECFHDTSLLLHALVALAVAALAFTLTHSFVAAAAAGGIFAVHPAHAEAVVWIAARADLTVTLCMVAALLAWRRYLDAGGGGRLLLACGAFGLGLLSKEMAVTVPALALCLWWARPGPRQHGRPWRGLAALVATLLAYVALRLFLVGSFRSYYEAPGGVVGALGNAVRFVADALVTAAWTGDRVAHPDWDVLRCAYGALIATLLLLARAPSLRLVVACGLALALSTAPVAGWAKLNADGAGTRLIYPSLVFTTLVLAAAAAHAWRRTRALTAVAVLGLLGTGLLGTRRATEPWQRAGAEARAIVTQLRTAAADADAVILSMDLPATLGPAYLMQNAFPAAAWLFVRAGLRVDWLPPAQWQTAVVEHREELRAQPGVRALRWDGAAGVWRTPDLR